MIAIYVAKRRQWVLEALRKMGYRIIPVTEKERRVRDRTRPGTMRFSH